MAPVTAANASNMPSTTEATIHVQYGAVVSLGPPRDGGAAASAGGGGGKRSESSATEGAGLAGAFAAATGDGAGERCAGGPPMERGFGVTDAAGAGEGVKLGGGCTFGGESERSSSTTSNAELSSV